MSALDQPGACGHAVCGEVGEMEENRGERRMSKVDKVCPVVFRDPSMRQILAFEHPLEGAQLVKGGIERGESLRAAALRELEEESGITDAGIAGDLGTWDSGYHGHVWSLQLCTVPRRLPESWTHHCADDG